jgi:hypothetical protein
MIVDCPGGRGEDASNLSVTLALDRPMEDFALPRCQSYLLQLLWCRNRRVRGSAARGGLSGRAIAPGRPGGCWCALMHQKWML